MEFPNLGKHCDNRTCSKLDFLPMKCDACSNVFCKDHISYTTHECPAAYTKDKQVPVCPLCNKPIPVGRDQTPDIIVGQHIDTDCQSDPAKAKRNVYSNKCSLKNCKRKESEDEALARALQMSLNEQAPTGSQSTPMTQDEMDRMLARQLQETEMSEERPDERSNNRSSSRNCIVA